MIDRETAIAAGDEVESLIEKEAIDGVPLTADEQATKDADNAVLDQVEAENPDLADEISSRESGKLIDHLLDQSFGVDDSGDERGREDF